MNQSNREYFDKQVGWVLVHLPRKILRLLLEIPLHVEDQPSKRLMEDLKIDNPDELCGCFNGVPFSGLANIHFLSACGDMPSSVTIFRRGIVAASRNEWGKVCRSELRQQIRITILHELAHLHGMDEDEIADIGYG